MPLVTVGLPFHNESRFLASAVRSVLAQTVTDFELLLVDDGSTDDSLAIARSFGDRRVIVLSDGHRRHLPARLNEITRRARGRFVARMDGDDLSHPRRIRAELDVLESDARCDAVGTLAGVIDEDDVPFGVVGSADLPRSRAAVLDRGLLVHASMLARREWLLANAYGEALTRAEDRDLWCRTVETSTFQVVDQPLYVVRIAAAIDRFLAGYVESHRQNRALFLRYGREAAGLERTARMLLASYAKVLVMRGAASVGLGGRVVRRRGRPAQPAELTMIREAIAHAAV